MAAVDHDHGFRLDDFQINQKIRKGTTVIWNSPLTKLALSNFAVHMFALRT